MKKLTPLIILFFLTTIASNHTMLMLSIEKGQIFTESYNLDHVLQASSISRIQQSSAPYAAFDSSRYFCHSHIKLTQFTIPENSTVPVAAPLFLAGIDISPDSSHFYLSADPNTSIKYHYSDAPLKILTATLLESTVLLI